MSPCRLPFALPLSLGMVLLLSCAEPVAPSDWMQTAQARIAADARAIYPAGAGFTCALPGLGLRARFDEGGVRVLDRERDTLALGLQTVGWGRGEAMATPRFEAPALGACVAETLPSGACVRRLERRDGPLTEWWVGQDAGLEQGFTVDARPEGDGPLSFLVAVDGALSLDGQGDQVVVEDADGRTWTVGALAAWDARGEPVPVTVAVEEGALRLVVDDRAARYPLTVDPVYSTAAWSTEGADGPPAGFHDVAGLGDVNGDGYDDVVIGSQYVRDGMAYVYHGSASGISEDAAATLIGEDPDQESFGQSVAGGGDVNGDGYDDLIVGALNKGASSQGHAYLFLGSADGVASTAATRFDAAAAGDYFARAVAIAGDLDGDGYDDVVIGAESSSLGRVYVYPGSASGVASAATLTLDAPTTSAKFGYALAGAGDVNADGYDDLIVFTWASGSVGLYLGSATGLATTATSTLSADPGGASYAAVPLSGVGDVNGDGYDDVMVSEDVFHGASTGLSTTAATHLSSAGKQSYFGGANAGAGDVNADGYDDVIVGALGSTTQTGAAYVYLGSASGIVDSVSTTLSGSVVGSQFGYSVAGAGDVNGDGYGDVMATTFEYYEPGTSNIYHGSASGVSSAAGTALEGVVWPKVGRAVAGAGDLNGDGYVDVLVGRYEGNETHFYGDYAVDVYHGATGGPATTAAVSLEPSTSDDGYNLSVLSGVGDVDGDGYDDVVLGAPYEGSGDGDDDFYFGNAFLYYGDAAGLSSSPDDALGPGSATSQFGTAVARLGDVNGDGYDDLGIGAPGYSGRRAPAAYVLYGAASGPSWTGATRWEDDWRTEFGSAMAGAGDIDGDGYTDVLVGAPSAPYDSGDDVGTGLGEASLFFGGADGASSAADWTVQGTEDDPSLGYALTGAGDVNGDGYADLLVSANEDEGLVSLYLGAVGGPGTLADQEIRTEEARDDFGSALAGLGDLDADGYADIGIGAPGNDDARGKAYVFHGSSAGLSASADQTFTGTNIGDRLGSALAGAGDMDGDGRDDLILGAPYALGGGSATIYLGYDDTDGDGDGVAVDDDCDDADATIHPGASEIPGDGIDQDCDGRSLYVTGAPRRSGVTRPDGVRPTGRPH